MSGASVRRRRERHGRIDLWCQFLDVAYKVPSRRQTTFRDCREECVVEIAFLIIHSPSFNFFENFQNLISNFKKLLNLLTEQYLNWTHYKMITFWTSLLVLFCHGVFYSEAQGKHQKLITTNRNQRSLSNLTISQNKN